MTKMLLVDSDAWLRELSALTKAGEERPYRVCVFRKSVVQALYDPPAFILYRWVRYGRDQALRVRHAVTVGLYAPDAAPGDQPLVIMSVQPDAPVGEIERGQRVMARGQPEPGHAMVLVDGDVVIPCAGPATIATLFRKRYAL